MPRQLIRVLLALLVLCLLAPRADAQELRGRVLDADSGSPITSGIVRADGIDGRLTSLTGSDGDFVLAVPDGFGLESLTVERIGYASRVFEAESLSGMDPLVLRVESTPIELNAIVATGENLCRERSDEGVAAIWDEVRKSLEITTLTERSRLVRFEVETYRRDLQPSDGSVLGGASNARTVTAASPYRSISVERMTERGWVEGDLDSGWELFAPDAQILLTDAFASQHCFRTEAAGDSVFMHFEPNRSRSDYPELEGTLVLDSESSELTELRFSYVGIPQLQRGNHAGGEIQFFAAPNGLRVVRRWAIRAPVMSQGRQRPGALGLVRIRVDRVREHGGRVLAVRAEGRVIDLFTEPLDLGGPDAVGDPENAGTQRVATSRTIRDGGEAQLLVRNDAPTPFRVTEVRLDDCINVAMECGDHPVDVTIQPGESGVVLSFGKERALDPFRFEWRYEGESVDEVAEAETDAVEAPGAVDDPVPEDPPVLTGRTGVEWTERESSPTFLNARDIDEGRFGDAFEVVASMRPQWLNLRPIRGPTAPIGSVRVYVDHVSRTPYPTSPPEEALRSIPAEAVQSVEYVDAQTATIRWGTGHGQGAIVVTTF